MKKLIAASVFFIPLMSMVPTNNIVWYTQLLALLFFGTSCVAMMFWKSNKFISLFLIYSCFSYLVICSQSTRSLFCFIVGFSAFLLMLGASKLRNIKSIYVCIGIMAILQCVYVVFQSFNIDPFFHRISGKGSDVVGFLGSRNQLGIYYASVGVILTSISPLLLPFALIPIFIAKQLSAMAGLAIGLITYSFFVWNRRVTASIALAVVLLTVPCFIYANKSPEKIMERVSLWKLTLNQSLTGQAIQKERGTATITANPWTGFGIGNFFTISPYTQLAFLKKDIGHRYEHAHNDLLEAFFEFGRIGLILIVFCFMRVIYDFINAYHYLHPNNKNLVVAFCCLIAQVVCSFGVYVFHAPVSLFMFFLTLGLFYAEVNYAKQS